MAGGSSTVASLNVNLAASTAQLTKSFDDAKQIVEDFEKSLTQAFEEEEKERSAKAEEAKRKRQKDEDDLTRQFEKHLEARHGFLNGKKVDTSTLSKEDAEKAFAEREKREKKAHETSFAGYKDAAKKREQDADKLAKNQEQKARDQKAKF